MFKLLEGQHEERIEIVDGVEAVIHTYENDNGVFLHFEFDKDKINSLTFENEQLKYYPSNLVVLSVGLKK